jgi:RNA polymerase sigma-B factor
VACRLQTQGSAKDEDDAPATPVPVTVTGPVAVPVAVPVPVPVPGPVDGTPTAPTTAAVPGPAAEQVPAATQAPIDSSRVDVRTLTRVLFERMSELTPRTPEHEHVRSALIEVNLPLVRYAAARFRGRSEPMEDVVQVGTIGLINAIDRFDPTRGVQFPTYALPTIQGEIKRYFRDNVRTMHVPRRLQELWVQVSAAMEDLTVAHGRLPKIPEIAANLRIPEEDVRACLDAGRAYNATSLEAAQENDGGLALLDRLGFEDSALTHVEHRDMVRHLLVQLPDRERQIVMLRFFGNLTQSQISTELGMSQMHVSRLLARIFARLRSSNAWES